MKHPAAHTKRSSKIQICSILLSGLLVLTFAGLGQAADIEKRVVTGWRAEGQVYDLSNKLHFYTGLMKGTFVVKEKEGPSRYLHAARMTCPFSVHINDAGNDEMQGMCQLEIPQGDRANAKISCTGPEENCVGKWTFTSGTGNFKGIKGESDLNIRVDLIKAEQDQSAQQFGRTQEASGYLIISELKDNVSTEGGMPKVK